MKQLASVAGSHSAPRGSTASLIMALVVAPVIVSLSFTAGIAFSRAGCQPAAAVLRSGSTLLAIIAAIAGGVAAMRRWRQLGAETDYPSGGAFSRDRFLGFAGFAASGGSLLLALYLGAVVLFLEPCW